LTVKGPGGASIEPAGAPLADRVDDGVYDPELPGLAVESARADSIVLSARASALVAAAPKALAFFIRDFDALDGRVALHGGRALVLDAGVYSIRPEQL
jgi:hypothetical protein